VPFPAAKQAVLYARVSSKEQEREGFSIPAQLKLLRDYAADKGIVVAREFIDVETAKREGRTHFGEMLRYLKKAKTCHVVLVEKTDRLYRNIRDWVTLDELDLEIHLVKECVVLSDESRSSEKFMHGIKVLMAKNYIDNLGEEASKGLRAKADEGMWPSFAPLGYRNVTNADGKKAMEPDPDLGPMVTQLFEWYATGMYSLKEIGKMARNAGFIYRKSGAPVSDATAHSLLRNRLYAGEFIWAGQLYRGKYEPLVSMEVWERVQEVMDGRNAKRPKKRVHTFALSNLVSCGHCGCALVGEIQKGRYIYYHCTGYKGKCPEPYTREEVLVERFADFLGQLSLDPEVLDWIVQALKESQGDQKQFHDEAVARLQAEYTRIDHRLQAMYVDKLDGNINLPFYERQSSEWHLEMERIQAKIADHREAQKSYFDEGVMILELASRSRELFLEADAARRNRLLTFVLSNCSWKGGQLSATYRPPFDLISERAVAARSADLAMAAGGGSGRDFSNWLGS